MIRLHYETNVSDKVSERQKKDSSEKAYLIDVMSARQKRYFRILVGIWLCNLILIIHWWMDLDHVVGWFEFGLNSVLLMYAFVLPGYFYYFISRMKRVNPTIDVPEHWRVAMVVTRAPSEPFYVVQKTLLAMLAQNYPHDNWLADEDPSEEIRDWCGQKGVKISCRKGVPEYHRAEWPRRTKCKEGNLAYFYDHYGYERYDYVVQLDADHVPSDGYLEAMLRPFVNPEIGYVSAPSICDSNASTSWSARGRLFTEAIMHGPLQAGYSDGYAPLCIGSHYAVRTRALREIGGLGPELAEDHSTTLMMNGHGWRGIHAFDAIASGEGPPTLGDCITQEFQWSRSLMVLLLTETPKYWSKLPVRMRFQFLFAQLWYPLFGLFMLTGHLLPIMAVLMHEPWVSISFLDFFAHTLPLSLSVLGIVWFLKKEGFLRPANSPIIRWETTLFQIVRWPWALYGSIMGVAKVISGAPMHFKVTPKDGRSDPALKWSVLSPYLMVILISFIPSVFNPDAGRANGYFIFLIFNLMIYPLTLLIIILTHRKETKKLRYNVKK